MIIGVPYFGSKEKIQIIHSIFHNVTDGHGFYVLRFIWITVYISTNYNRKSIIRTVITLD